MQMSFGNNRPKRKINFTSETNQLQSWCALQISGQPDDRLDSESKRVSYHQFHLSEFSDRHQNSDAFYFTFWSLDNQNILGRFFSRLCKVFHRFKNMSFAEKFISINLR
jgi:hypothetical protein